MQNRLIVEKYGGSSVGSPEKIKKIAAQIAQKTKSGEQIVVVVSAMGDTTDELLELAHKVSDKPIHVHERELDVLLSAGERISMALLAMALRDVGVESISFTGSQAGIITDESHTRAKIIEIRPIRVEEELKRGKVVIVAGFQGVSRSKEITTLGRGGSDTTAVAMAAALHACECRIFTDVAGIYSADPRVVADAIHYDKLPLEVVLEMSKNGAQVMHRKSLDVALQNNLTLYVGLAHLSFETQKPQSGEFSSSKSGTFLIPQKEFPVSRNLPKIIAVTSKKNLVHIKIQDERCQHILDELKKDNIEIFDFVVQDKALSLLLDPNESSGILERFKNSVQSRKLSVVSVVGTGDAAFGPETTQRLKKAFDRFHPLNLTSSAQSIINNCPASVHAWIDEDQNELAAKEIHKEFILNR